MTIYINSDPVNMGDRVILRNGTIKYVTGTWNHDYKQGATFVQFENEDSWNCEWWWNNGMHCYHQHLDIVGVLH